MAEIYRSPWFDLEGYLACTCKDSDGRSYTVLAHREIMERHLNRALEPHEIVHHVDRDKRNNDPSNLELRTRSTHASEHARRVSQIDLVCIQCGRSFTRSPAQFRKFLKMGKAGPFCSKACVGKAFLPHRLSTAGIPHGTDSGYGYWKCRCDVCRAGHTQRAKDSRNRRLGETGRTR